MNSIVRKRKKRNLLILFFLCFIITQIIIYEALFLINTFSSAPTSSNKLDWISLFRETGNKFQLDKIYNHHYEYLYGIHLGPLRDEPINLLEIGLGCVVMATGPGKSLLLWNEYFPKASVSILEYDRECAEPFRSQVKNLYIGDQSDFNVLEEVGTGGPYDVIIDDGGHTRRQQINSLIGLWPYVKSGGFYIVEDIFTSFLDEFNDNPEENTMDVMHQLIVLLMDARDINYPTRFPGIELKEYSKKIAKDLLFVSCFKRACILNKK